MPVVACVARKLRPCPSYSTRGDRLNSVLLRSLDAGGGGGGGLCLVGGGGQDGFLVRSLVDGGADWHVGLDPTEIPSPGQGVTPAPGPTKQRRGGRVRKGSESS